MRKGLLALFFAVTLSAQAAERPSFYVIMNPAAARTDPGGAATIEMWLTNYPPTTPGTRFFLELEASNGTIESIDAPAWACSIDGATARCGITALTNTCCVDDPLHVTVRTNADPAGGETRLAFDASSDPEGELWDQGYATIEIYRHVLVTTTADAGPGSLRAAFDDVNAHCDRMPCKVNFAIPAPVPAEGWFTIVPETPLPVIRTRRVILDATTQTRFTGDTNPRGPEVAIDGRVAGEGLEIHANCDAVVQGFALGNFMTNQALWFTQDRRPCDIRLQAADRFSIADNHIGVDPAGTTPWPNLRGLRLDDAAVGVQRNIISENRYSGVWLWQGAVSFRENRIERNGASGIFFGPAVQYGEVVRNTISGHPHMGVAIARGASRIDVRQNSMKDNAGLGIDWGLDGPTPNAESDTGAPSNAPLLLSATYDAAANETVVTLTLRSNPIGSGGNSWVLDFYTNAAPDGDGETFIHERQLFPPLPGGSFEVRIRGDHSGKWLNATSSRVYWWFSRPGEPRTESFAGGETWTSELSNSVQVTK